MKRAALAAIAAFALSALAVGDVTAAKLGGFRSFGAQRPGITPRTATPPAAAPSGAASQPVMPAQPGATLPARPAATPAGAAPSGASRWLGPIAGIAAGLGLAALLAHFGLPEGLGSVVLLALLVFGAVLAVRMLFARRSQGERPLAYAPGRGARTTSVFETPPAPQWGGASRIEPTLASGTRGADTAFPPGFDAMGFVRHAKEQFVRLQKAYDAGNRTLLAEVMTPDMAVEIGRELDGAATRVPSRIEALDADVFEVATKNGQHWASVRFTGTLREGDAAPVAFDEVWHLTKPADGSSGWLLAGIQQPA